MSSTTSTSKHPCTVQHFAINADDVDRAKRFYERVFGWDIEPWGPPEFFQINTGDGIRGALQKRRELEPGTRMPGFECTIAVADVDETARAIVESGGRIIMDKATIAGVGHLIFFSDSEGNIAGAMQYDAKAE